MPRVLEFFHDNLPTGPLLAWSPVMLAWSLAALSLAGWLKQRRGWMTGYTRKVFHFITFATVAALMHLPGQADGGGQISGGTDQPADMRAVCLFAVATSLVVFFAMTGGRQTQDSGLKTQDSGLRVFLYEAIAREKDAPHRTWFIFVSYLATLIGGLMTSIGFGRVAIVGFLITGIADAVAEPVGTRFGRHRYRVPTLSRTISHRSLEGSAAVFVASLVCLFAAAALTPAIGWRFDGPRLAAIVAIAAIATFAEAVSPHGWDNLTMQVLPTWLAWTWMT